MNENQEQKILGLWMEIKVLVDSMEREIDKNLVKDNLTAGVRVRKDLRLLKEYATELIKVSCSHDGKKKIKRVAEKKAGAPQ